MFITIINKTYQSIKKHFILYKIKIVYCQGDMFRPLLGHFRPSEKIDPRAICVYIYILDLFFQRA